MIGVILTSSSIAKSQPQALKGEERTRKKGSDLKQQRLRILVDSPSDPPLAITSTAVNVSDPNSPSILITLRNTTNSLTIRHLERLSPIVLWSSEGETPSPEKSSSNSGCLSRLLTLATFAPTSLPLAKSRLSRKPQRRKLSIGDRLLGAGSATSI